jgi:acyl carrier protein
MQESIMMQTIKQVVATTLNVPVESVQDDSSPATLPQWDSLAHLNLVMALESQFCVKFTLDEIIGLRDVATIRQFIQRKKGA